MEVHGCENLQPSFSNLRIEEEGPEIIEEEKRKRRYYVDGGDSKPREPTWFDENQRLFRSKLSGSIYTFKQMLMERSRLIDEYNVNPEDSFCKARIEEIERRRRKLVNLWNGIKTYGMPFLFYKARIGVMDMLFDRGYDIDAAQINASYSDFTSQFIEELTSDGPGLVLDCLNFVAARKSDPDEKVLVVFLNLREIDSEVIHGIQMNYPNEKLSRVIPVTWNYMHPKDAEELQSLSPFKLEFFQVYDLNDINLRASVKRCKYVVLTAKEREDLLKMIKMEDIEARVTNLHHPNSEYYGLEKGQIVKIVTEDVAEKMVSPGIKYIIIN